MKLGYHIEHRQLIVTLEGDFKKFDDEKPVAEVLHQVRRRHVDQLSFNAEKLGRWDSTLTVVLFEILHQAKAEKIKTSTAGLPENLRNLLELALTVDRKPERPPVPDYDWAEDLGMWGEEIYRSFRKGVDFMAQTVCAAGRWLGGCAVVRKIDFDFAVEDSGYKAVGIVSLVSFMVGLILAFVGAIQLKNFGAQIYVASLVTIGMTRIMGAIMVGIIMAGRTGASYAATIGTMQVNEEIDALRTMGIPVTEFLILPRIGSLLVTMPFLVILADFMGMAGGAAVSVGMLDIPLAEYWRYSQAALNMKNFLVGIFHGVVYALVIAWCGCYYGMNSGRNADGVGVATTKAVVSAIVWMIVVTGILTWIFEAVGI